MPSYAFLWRTSDFSMEIGETATITLSHPNKGGDSISIWEDGVQIGTTTTNTYEYTPTSAGTHTLHYFNTIECSPLTVTVTRGSIVSSNDTTTLNGALTELGETIANNLTSMGVTASANDGLTTLASKVLQINNSSEEIVSFDNITTEFNYTLKRGNYGFSVTIPSGVTTLGDYCFSNCNGLTSVTIPNSVTALGDYCFGGCAGLTSITIPNGVITLGRGCFTSCAGLTSITIPSGVTSLRNACFASCTGLTSVTVPSGVTTLEDYCFNSCAGLTSIIIPSGVTSLGNACFAGCNGLTNVTIPSSVTTLGTNCFRSCSKLVDYQLYWETPPVTWDSTLMPNNTNTIFTIPNGTAANYTAKSFPSDKLIERSE